MNSPQPLSPSAFYQAQFNRLLAHQQAIEAELTNRNLQELPIEKLFRLSDLVSRQLQRLLKAAAPVSNQIKPDQGSPAVVEAAILAAGDGGFQPPVPLEPASNQIKVIQASTSNSAARPSTVPVGTDSTPSPTVAATIPSIQIKPDQGSAPSTPLEHCLRCAEPLPPLLPNGRRPDHYCKCGSPIMAPPGTSLLERCPDCGEPQRPHGYNAFRQDNRCHKCWRNLPPLDPKSPTTWLPPTRSAPPALN
ncbi:MAG TPA: hypothetical protein VNT26_13635 [Candidatus Sulfotelmatobacter sp.]|nr:hypothetical protein [Candidatus Sulfotelmatobacter sp.]